jgi:hypothetical protein
MLLPNPNEENTHALKTICGAVHYYCVLYQKKEIPVHDWEYLCSYLNIPSSTIYSLEIDNKTLVVNYRDFHRNNALNSNPISPMKT